VSFLLSVLLAVASASIPEDLLRSGMKSMTEGRFAEARTDLESASQSAPTNPQVCLLLTQLYARLKEEKLRGASANRCIALAHHATDWETKATVRDYLAKVYLADGDFSKAIAEYRDAVDLNPYEEAYRFDLGQSLLNHEMFAEAAEALEDAHRVFDKSAQLELALGVAYYGQRRFPEAVNSFLRTIQLAPDVVQPYVFLGRMLDQSGDRLPEITNRFRAFAKDHPDNYLGGLLLSKSLGAASGSIASGYIKERETLLRGSMKLKPDYWESHYELGALLESEHAYKDSAVELIESVKLNPDIADAHYHLSRVYDRLDKPEEAARERQIHQQLTARNKVSAGMEVLR
jgi:tetratricopeptide (TPR) repeat protein